MSTLQTQEPTQNHVESVSRAADDKARASEFSAERLGKNYFGAIVSTLLALLLTVAFAECVVRIVVVQASPPDGKDQAFDAKLAVARSVSQSKDPVIICLGNSVGTTGIYSEYIQAKLQKDVPNIRVVNLSTTGDCMEEKCFLAKTALGDKSAPRLIVFQFCTTEVEKELAQIADPTQRFKQSYVGSHLAREPQNIGDRINDFFNQHSYLVRYQKTWRGVLQTAITNITETDKRTGRGSTPQIARECSPGGWAPWYEFSPEKGFDQFTLQGWIKYYQKFGKVPTSEWIWDFSRIAEVQQFCKKEGVPLMYLWMPELTEKTTQYSVKHFTVEQCMAGISNYLGKEASQFIDLHDGDHDPTHYCVWDHNTIPGALKSGELLAEKLSESQFVKSLKR